MLTLSGERRDLSAFMIIGKKIMKFEKKRKIILTEKGRSFYPIEKCNSIFELISIIFHDYLKFRIHINTDFTI